MLSCGNKTAVESVWSCTDFPLYVITGLSNYQISCVRMSQDLTRAGFLNVVWLVILHRLRIDIADFEISLGSTNDKLVDLSFYLTLALTVIYFL